MKTGVIIQARRSSSRLRDKILMELPMGSGITVLENVVKRAKLACETVIVATSDEESDSLTAELAEKYGAFAFRGSLNDVLSRYVGAAKKFQLDKVVRITGDCPCIDPDILKGVIALADNDCDYASNVEDRCFPHGMDTECVTAEALFRSDREEKRPEIREHVTLHIRRSEEYKKLDYTDGGDKKYAGIRVTLDTQDDYTALSAVFGLLPQNFSWCDIVSLYEKQAWLALINSKVYQKNAFSTEQEELVEAQKLLKLHGMECAAAFVGKRQV